MPNGVDYSKVLNPSQLQAVMTLEGPLLVIAGAGSGKTRTLVYRVARLVETGVPPENILLLTFTRKAAGEMLERAAGLADERCRRVSGGTFHSLAHRVLRSKAELLGFDGNFIVLDRSDMEESIQSLVRDLQTDRGSVRFPKRATLASILSKAANLQVPVEDLMRDEYSQFVEHIPQINNLARLYREYKRDNQLMDYDDLLLFFRRLLADREEIREALGSQYRYLMVDEYQDTNGIQADIVKWLARSHGNVMVVGDDSQSVYSFRGADYRNMFEFPNLFPEAKIIKLEENYRSTQPILSFTNALMDQARERYTKCLRTRRLDGDRPRVVDTRTDPEQALFVSRTIKDLLVRGRPLRDMAVLFRAAYHSFELEAELTRQGIPYVKYGGFKFMESAHIKDLLGHLRGVVNGEDGLSWGRILRLIPNIGQGKSQAIINWMREEKRPPWQVHEWPRSGKGDAGLEALSHLLKRISSQGMTPGTAVELAAEYYRPMLKERFDDFPRREKELEQLASMAGRYRRLRPFLDELVLEPPSSPQEVDPVQKGDYLTLSTVHSAKGLEWGCVFILWVMDGYFPSAKGAANPETLEEERRLMYVAATRAKDELILCYPGQESPPFWQLGDSGRRGGPSAFIQALPEGVMEQVTMGRSFLKAPARRSAPVRRPAAPASPPVKEKAHASGLRPGDRVRHPAFGKGVVSRFRGKEKVEVLFGGAGRKLLHLAYTTLEKV
ncbi:MAG: DUF3553 domain-containing protein [Deltaproteobacteria bacterium]|nr:DUF3553 domain-containing protein [Deltaproteobacteria bacterium]